jgi:hypothetical protein
MRSDLWLENAVFTPKKLTNQDALTSPQAGSIKISSAGVALQLARMGLPSIRVSE